MYEYMEFVAINQFCYEKVYDIPKTSDSSNFDFSISNIEKFVRPVLSNQIKTKKGNGN